MRSYSYLQTRSGKSSGKSDQLRQHYDLQQYNLLSGSIAGPLNKRDIKQASHSRNLKENEFHPRNNEIIKCLLHMKKNAEIELRIAAEEMREINIF